MGNLPAYGGGVALGAFLEEKFQVPGSQARGNFF